MLRNCGFEKLREALCIDMDESSSSPRPLSSRKGTAARPIALYRTARHNSARHNSARHSLPAGHLPPSASLSVFRQTVDETQSKARIPFELPQLISVAGRRALSAALPGAVPTSSASARYSALPKLALSSLVSRRVLPRGVATPP